MARSPLSAVPDDPDRSSAVQVPTDAGWADPPARLSDGGATTGQPHLDTGARALDALPAEEIRAFEAHLADCPPCAAEYREFTETVALLGAAVAIDPAAALHRSVMRLVDITPQTPPVVSPVAFNGGPARSDRSGPLRRWYRRPPALLAAAVLALLVIAGGILASVRGTEAPPTAEQCVEHAADARVVTPTVGVGGSVRFAPSCRAALVITPKLPALAGERGYRLWVMAGSAATSEGLISASATPSGVVVPVTVGDTAVGVSVEPSGGSDALTTDPIWVVPLTG